MKKLFIKSVGAWPTGSGTHDLVRHNHWLICYFVGSFGILCFLYAQSHAYIWGLLATLGCTSPGICLQGVCVSEDIHCLLV